MTTQMYERCKGVAAYIVKKGCTVREAAEKFEVGKTTIHKDATTRIRQIDPELAEKAKIVLESNKAERHIRGGNATRAKFAKEREELTD